LLILEVRLRIELLVFCQPDLGTKMINFNERQPIRRRLGEEIVEGKQKLASHLLQEWMVRRVSRKRTRPLYRPGFDDSPLSD
jgi:hypothetical protein